MIEDEELSNLFQVESEEHLNKIEEGLLEIEKDPNDLDTMHIIFRAAHSLKGAARMLGIQDIETLSHLIEDQLGKASKGEYEVTSSQIDRFYYSIDMIRKLVDEAITGDPAGVDVIKTIDILQEKAEIPGQGQKLKKIVSKDHLISIEIPEQEFEGKTFSENATYEEYQEESSISKIEQAEISEVPSENKDDKTQEPVKDNKIPIEPVKIKSKSSEKVKHDTMRVESHKLDSLMVQTGELIVTKLRIGRRLKDIEDIKFSFEEFQKLNQEAKQVYKFLENKEYDKDSALTLLSNLYKKVREKTDLIEKSLEELQKKVSNDSTKLDLITGKLEDGIQNIRMLPLSSVFNLFNRTVRDLAREAEKDIEFKIEGGDITADKQIIEEMKDPLMHLIRNAIDHGIENKEERELHSKQSPASLILSAKNRNNVILIELKDDGKGIDKEKVKSKALEKNLFTKEELEVMDEKSIYQIIFMHGFSTRSEVSEISGRGVGMDVVKTFIDDMKGTIDIHSEKGKGTIFSLHLPMSFSTTHVLIIEVENQIFGLPIDYVVLSKIILVEDIFTLEGENTINIEGEPIPITFLKNRLELKEDHSKLTHSYSCITISDGIKKLGLLVDRIVDKQEVIMKPLGGFLQKVRNVSGGTILESGEICIILNPKELLYSKTNKVKESIHPGNINTSLKHIEEKILLVEDSGTIRTQILRILENNNFKVDTAIDGRDAFEKISKNSYSLILTDVEMPNMNGFELTKKIRSIYKMEDLPIVILTTLASQENIHAGMEAGANAYLTKSSFDQKTLVDTIRRFL
ncbi:MAG: hybrid sensor histidine kinase/response regulator [Leptospiraceae bacterium]|nr:hybrid sensor histidine kinase/response regulator [Leptospiraceae bacterium]